MSVDDMIADYAIEYAIVAQESLAVKEAEYAQLGESTVTASEIALAYADTLEALFGEDKADEIKETALALMAGFVVVRNHPELLND